MKKLLEYLRLAQFYSDAAKGSIYFIESKSLMNAAKNKSKDMLYLYKTDYLRRAAKRACAIGQKPYYDIENSCIYFELPNGQVSFHVYDTEEIISSYCTCETHEWSGKEDSRFIINEYFNKERIF